MRKEASKKANKAAGKENESRGEGEGGERSADGASIRHSDSYLPCQLRDASVMERRTLHICCRRHICSASRSVCERVCVRVNHSVFVVTKQRERQKIHIYYTSCHL